MRNFVYLAVLVVGLSAPLRAQFGTPLDTHLVCQGPRDLSKSLYNKPLSFGLTFTQGFTTVRDDSFSDYFVKPSIGGGVVAFYSPVPWVSLGVGFTHQQHGAGILMPDNVSGVGNGDSTYRTRFRMNTWNVPISLTLRTPEIYNGTRISVSGGVVQNRLIRATQVYLSIEDGFHSFTERTDDVLPRFWEYFYSAGFEVEIPRSAVLQVHYVFSATTGNVYKESGYFAGRQGVPVSHGLRVTTRF